MSGRREASEPATTGGPGQATTAPGEKADAARRTARVLILEDDASDAELAQHLLTGAGLDFTAVVVDARTSFVEQLAAFRPHLILSDFHLPGFSGEMALKIAQEQCPDIPFIIWSGVLGDEAAVDLIRSHGLRPEGPAGAPAISHPARARRGRATGVSSPARRPTARSAAPGKPGPAGRRRRGREPHPSDARRRPPASDNR